MGTERGLRVGSAEQPEAGLPECKHCDPDLGAQRQAQRGWGWGHGSYPLRHIEGLESLGTRDFRGTEAARGLRTGQTGSRRILTLASLPAAWPWGILSFSLSSVKGDDDNMQLLQEVTREGVGDLVFKRDRASV